MYIQSVKFKRKQDSNWEKGFYIGRCENDVLNKSTFLDSSYQALERDEKGFQVWDSNYDLDTDVQLRLSIEGEFSKNE